MTRALAKHFGEVHAVDVSGEMVTRARQAVADYPNAFIHQNNGTDLSIVPDLRFDFAFSCLVFQHVPKREIIYRYAREVHRLLAPGALLYALHAADGTPIMLTDSREAAIANAWSQELETVSVH